MIITVASNTDPALVRQQLVGLGLWVRRFDGEGSVEFVVEPHSTSVSREQLLALPGVQDVLAPRSATPLLDRQSPVVRVGSIEIGGSVPVLVAGPCSLESEERIFELARRVAESGAKVLRGGAYKPRTSPYDFQGHGRAALTWMRHAADHHGLMVVTEAMAPSEVPIVADHADMVQIGSRNMQNFPLLRAAGASGRAVLLKRGMASTIDEWLSAAEYLLLHGAAGVVCCERGIRSFDPTTRFTLDLAAVAYLAHVRRVPIVVDPSHATGRRDLVVPLARAAMAAGASGLMIEVHDEPGEAFSDGAQAIAPAILDDIAQGMFGARRATAAAPVANRAAWGDEMA